MNIPEKYGALPAVIETADEHDRMIEMVGQLMQRGEDNLSPEEGRLLDLLANLIVDYESKIYPPADLPPNELLQFLIEENGLRKKDLVEIFGAESRVSDAVNGKRAISKTQAKKLGAQFRVSSELFI